MGHLCAFFASSCIDCVEISVKHTDRNQSHSAKPLQVVPKEAVHIYRCVGVVQWTTAGFELGAMEYGAAMEAFEQSCKPERSLEIFDDMVNVAGSVQRRELVGHVV